MLATYFSSFWLQAVALSLLVMALELRGRSKDALPSRLRRAVIETVLWVAIFAAISGGRGCAPTPWWAEDDGATTTKQDR